jgi:hypothetical protein
LHLGFTSNLWQTQQNCIFSGASAGSWNSLFMVYKRDNHGDIMNNIFEINFSKSDSIKNLQLRITIAMKGNNIIQEKSFAFAVRAVKLFKYLQEEKKEYVLSKQFLRSATFTLGE